MYNSHLDSTVIIFWKRFKGGGSFAFTYSSARLPQTLSPTPLLRSLSFIYEYCDLLHGSPYVRLYSPVTSLTDRL